jgi:hypothetical protein
MSRIHPDAPVKRDLRIRLASHFVVLDGPLLLAGPLAFADALEDDVLASLSRASLSLCAWFSFFFAVVRSSCFFVSASLESARL